MPAALRRYCEFILATLGSPDALIPPQPPLTRYKRELAVEAEQAEAAAFASASQVWVGGGAARCGA